MKRMSFSELTRGSIRRKVEAEKEILLTDQGRPVAMVWAITPEALALDLFAWRRTRDPAGTEGLTLDAVEAEIAEARRQMQARRARKRPRT